MYRIKTLVGVVALAALIALPEVATAQQALSLNLGRFIVKGESGRVRGDTLVANLGAEWPYASAFRLEDLNNVTFGAEWLVPAGKFLEGGIGVGYYASTVPSRYRDLENQRTGGDIEQDLRLRIVPLTATIRFLPTGRRAAVQPYVGVGVGVYLWRYSETGEFADSDLNLFRADFVANGTSVGPVVLGGVRFPLGLNFMLGGELRYQKGEGELSSDFLGNRIDLGGMTYQMTFVLRF